MNTKDDLHWALNDGHTISKPTPNLRQCENDNLLMCVFNISKFILHKIKTMAKCVLISHWDHSLIDIIVIIVIIG